MALRRAGSGRCSEQGSVLVAKVSLGGIWLHGPSVVLDEVRPVPELLQG